MAGNHRVLAGTKRGRQLTSAKAPSRSAHARPSVSGKKEAARGERFYMEDRYPCGMLRSAPVLQIHSKASHEAYIEAAWQEHEK